MSRGDKAKETGWVNHAGPVGHGEEAGLHLRAMASDMFCTLKRWLWLL